jgi:cellulose synthase/poly-beta-1,6-N-acetylglucosamine synthase-like glycosyltransferase
MTEPHAGDDARDATHITVMIATLDRPDSLERALRSVLASDYPSFDVIVVDNAEHGELTPHMLTRRFAGDDTIQYVREPRTGLARAHNAGLKLVHAPLVAITDDDVIVDPSWLRHVADAFSSSPEVMCVTGMIRAAELVTDAQVWVEEHLGFSKGDSRRSFDLGPNRPSDRLFPFTAGQLGSGANMSFRTAFLREIGGFDPALGAGSTAKGGDDLAAFYEVIVRGYRLVYEPAAVVYHHHHRTFEQLDRQVRGYGVGLGAFLTKVALERPANVAAMATRCAPALRHMRAMRTPRAAGTTVADARFSKLQRAERLAALGGPWAYIRSRRMVRLEAGSA